LILLNFYKTLWTIINH